MKRKPVKTNAQALDWCKKRRAVTVYKDWSEDYKKLHLRPGVLCGVILENNKCFLGNTLMQAVNRWIKWKNEADECQLKPQPTDAWIYL